MTYMAALPGEAQAINARLCELQETLQKKTWNLTKIRKEIDAIIAEIASHQLRLTGYCNRFKVKPVTKLLVHPEFVTSNLNMVTLYLKDSKINFEMIRKMMGLAHDQWSKTYLSDFKLLLSTFAIGAFKPVNLNMNLYMEAEGIHLSAEMTLYGDSRTAFRKMLLNAWKAENLFFSFARSKKRNALTAMKTQMKTNRTTSQKTQVINAVHLSARALLTVTIASVAETLVGVDQKKLTDREAFTKLLKWHTAGGMKWNREKLLRGKNNGQTLHICFQHQPQVGQLANFMLTGVGSYSDQKKSDILYVINLVTKPSDDEENSEAAQKNNEKKLAKLFIQFLRGDSKALSDKTLTAEGFAPLRVKKDQNTLLQRLNRIIHLVGIQEIYRRKNQGCYEDGTLVPELPFGIAVSMLLKLLSDGHLRMAEVFSGDSDYGVFTGSSIMKDNRIDTMERFNKLFALFVKKYAKNDAVKVFKKTGMLDLSKMNLIFTTEFFHQLLRQTNGGESDSDNESYPYPIEDANSGRVGDLIKKLKVAPLQIAEDE